MGCFVSGCWFRDVNVTRSDKETQKNRGASMQEEMENQQELQEFRMVLNRKQNKKVRDELNQKVDDDHRGLYADPVNVGNGRDQNNGLLVNQYVNNINQPAYLNPQDQ